jgi:single-strand DNA-binding protein
MPEPSGDEPVNEVLIRGRVSGDPRERELPSGDSIVSIRVVVPRPTTRRRPPGAGARVGVDTFECVAWLRRHQQAVRRLTDGDHVLVTGALRRRFWRAGAAVASLVEIEVASVRRLTTPAPVTAVRGRSRRRASDA